ncbi:DUF4145 domain-containing protein [Herbiconiux flava]|uniref:DUF4145 domain-containing protein n=1 Tax=Herbiconiux flava TaxID=881268 RepID=A0A852SP44_9MICO|nr:DUF4145 domain-containing protein [Herbiconiux flava]NYD70577.1 hypothetical protein [Herbiconiux flava]GLK17334.1 hypothetical protein GCM10017602_18160 [Herbiconiux flava]
MASSLGALHGWLTTHEWPRVACPICDIGSVGFEKAHHYPDRESQAHLDHERHYGGPYEELTGWFSGSLKCNEPKCGQVLAMSGKWGYFVNDGDPKYGQMGDAYWIQYVTPPLLLFRVPDRAPQAVMTAVTAASELLWVNPSAAANQLRQGIEALLTAKRIPKTVKTAKGKRERLSTHRRIQLYKAVQPRVGEALEAVKWIGNSGSHEAVITPSNVLEGAEILELALRDLFDQTDQQLMAKVRQINKRKKI